MSRPQEAFPAQVRLQASVRCLLIPLAASNLLTPGTTVAEVTVGGALDPVPDTPEWLLGIMSWRGRRVPLVDFERMAGIAARAASTGRVVVLNTLNGNPRLPFIALPAGGIPRLFPADATSVRGSGEAVGGVGVRVEAGEVSALIPDIDALERMLGQLRLD